MEYFFSHEKLNVYQKALEFVRWWQNVKKSIKAKTSIIDQMDRACDSIPLNIAEGTGKYTGKDKARYYDIARGSSLECAACLDDMEAREILSDKIVIEGKTILKEIVSMLFGLIKSVSDRSYEPEENYEAE